MKILKTLFNYLQNRASKPILNLSTILYNVIGIFFFIMSLHYIKELKSDDPGYIMFKKNHWVASDTTYHNGFLNITVIDKVTGQNAEIEQIYLSNSKLGDVGYSGDVDPLSGHIDPPSG